MIPSSRENTKTELRKIHFRISPVSCAGLSSQKNFDVLFDMLTIWELAFIITYRLVFT